MPPRSNAPPHTPHWPAVTQNDAIPAALHAAALAPAALGHCVNLFEITNRNDLTSEYRLLTVRGISASGGNYDKMLNQLVKQVTYDIQQPVALVRQGDGHALAIPADAELPPLVQNLSPSVAQLAPESGTHPLDFARLDSGTSPISTAFLQYALRTPLMRDRSLWGGGALWYRKDPLSAHDPSASVDLYPGFVWNVVTGGDGRPYIAVDTTVRYAERAWLVERLAALGGQDLGSYRFRRCLYHYGHEWFVVQLMGLCDLSISQQMFVPDGEQHAIDVYAYTRRRWNASPPPSIQNLDPDGRAIIYRYPGNQKERHGALALCKLLLTTAENEAAGSHRRSIISTEDRFVQIGRVVEQHFQRASLAGRRIDVAREPLQIERRIFQVPPLLFAHNRVLTVAPDGKTVNNSHASGGAVSLEQLGSRRQRMYLDPHAGPLDRTPFDTQYMLQPLSAPRAVNEDFLHRFQETMRAVSGRTDYTLKRVLYDDRGAKSLYHQVQAIRQAIGLHNMSRGYALLVLPARAERDLSKYIKKVSWPNLQIQCANAGKIASHYQPDGNGGLRVPSVQHARMSSYTRYCAYAMMALNRKWPWALASSLRYDAYIGIDVLHNVAGFTFVYDRGRHIYFQDHPSKQPERLTTAQLRQVLASHLREHLKALGITPRSIIVHRDGRAFASEIDGIHRAVGDLQKEHLLPLDVRLGIVEIRKTTADHLRIAGIAGPAVVRPNGQSVVQNPTIGSYFVLNPREGIVCTTGQPFRFPGTAKPLAAVIADGDLDIEWVLEDLFALSQLVFTAPDKCARLPVTIKLADDFLEPIASAADDEAAQYDVDPDAYEDEDDGIRRVAS